nr:hypothetical protein GCM10020093_094490 [Planobispora longispora]
MAFYLTLPLLAAVLARVARLGGGGPGARAVRLLGGLAVLIAISIGLVLLAHQPGMPPEINMLLPRYYLWFAPGMALAVLAAWAKAEPSGRVARLCVTIPASR